MDWTKLEQEESQVYAPGTPVQFKSDGSRVYYIEEYDPMMVPPVWLRDYAKPCYPEELRIVSNLFCIIPQKTLQVA